MNTRTQELCYPELKQLPIPFTRDDVLRWAKRESWKDPGVLAYILIPCLAVFLFGLIGSQFWPSSLSVNTSALIFMISTGVAFVGTTIDRNLALRRTIRRAIEMGWLPECPVCRYDMQSLTIKVCPECGYEQGPLRKDLWESMNNI